VNGTPYTSLRAKTSVKKKRPIDTEFIKTTIIGNLAALGLFAPSSLDILTLRGRKLSGYSSKLLSIYVNDMDNLIQETWLK
jgi:hypothetical protein